MLRLAPISTLTDTLFPYPTVFRSRLVGSKYFILSAFQGDACGLCQSGNRLCRRWKSVAIHGGYMDDGRADICSGGFDDHGVWSHCSLSGRIISHKNTLYVHVLALSYREWYFRWAYPVHSRFVRGSDGQYLRGSDLSHCGGGDLDRKRVG